MVLGLVCPRLVKVDGRALAHLGMLRPRSPRDVVLVVGGAHDVAVAATARAGGPGGIVRRRGHCVGRLGADVVADCAVCRRAGRAAFHFRRRLSRGSFICPGYLAKRDSEALTTAS